MQPHRSRKHLPTVLTIVATVALIAALVIPKHPEDKPQPTATAVPVVYGPAGSGTISQPTRAEIAAAIRATPCDRTALTDLDLTRPPTEAELIAAGNLGEALTPTAPADADKAATPDARARIGRDNLAFGHAIQAWNSHRYGEAVELFRRHLLDFPDSPWKAESMLHLGCACEYQGRYQESATWFDGILATTREATPMWYKTLLRRSALHINQANFDEAAKGLARLHKDDPDPDHKTYASYWIREIGLLKQNEVAIRDCGQKSLARVAEIHGDTATAARLRAMDAAGPHGFTARELITTASANGMIARPVQAGSALASLPLPFIAHYNDRHFVTVEKLADGQVTLHDSRVGQTHNIPESSFRLQWSGFALLFAPAPEVAGITPAGTNLDSIMGGCCGLPRYTAQLGNDPCAKKNCGLPGWSVNNVNMNFRMQDTPMWWNAPVGPSVHMSMLFNSLDALNNLEPFGPKWSFEYASYVLIDPGEGVTVRDGDGRFERFTGNPNGTYPYTYTAAPGDFRTLTQTAGHAFDLIHQDGTTYRYGIAGLMQGNSHVPLLLEIEDRHGNKVMVDHNQYGAITAIRHSSLPNQQWTLVYDETLPTGVSRVKRIDDPFGRSCHFTYDANYRLTGQTDMGGLQYSYTYTVKNAKEGGTVDPEVFVTSITTPKGTTSILTEPADGDDSIGTNTYPPAGGPMWENYRITVTDQEDNTEEYHWDGISAMYHRDPTQFSAGVAPPSTSHIKHNIQLIAGKGKIYSSYSNAGGTSVKVWSAGYNSTSGLTNEVSKKTTSSGLASTRYSYNSNGLPISIKAPGGSSSGGDDYETVITYASNNQDVAQVQRKLGGVMQTLAGFTYYSNRDLHTATDALGRTLTYVWKPDGRLESVTDSATSDDVLVEYDAGLRPSAIKLNDTTVATMAHDSMGRMLSSAGADGDTSTFTYDDLDRMTSATGADNTITRWNWACCFLDEIRSGKMDGTTEKVLRRVKQTHDKRGLLTSTTDTSGGTLRYGYDAAGRMASFKDAAGKETTWAYDGHGRLATKTYPDNTTETTTWLDMELPEHVINRRGQLTRFTWGITRQPDQILVYPTSSPASWTFYHEYSYDHWGRLTKLDRRSSTNVLESTHTLTHDLLGRVASLEGPWADDTLTWTYNNAARQVTRGATGGEGAYTETVTADTLGRLATVVNPLGTFTMAYTGNTDQVTGITHSGGFDTAFAYTGQAQGRALASILSKIPGGATVAKHSYTYDDLGQIATWKREAQLANPGTTHEYEWTLAHDYSGQLTSAVEKSLTGSLRDSWSFGYDAAGNRFSATRSGAPGSTAQAMTATHNAMNQITTLGGGGRSLVSGSLDEPGQVSVGIAGQGDKPARMLAGNRFEADVVLPSGTSTLAVTAADAQGNTAHQQYSVATAPLTARTMTYDADGNLTSDGERTYEWDAWSRLTKITWATGKTTDISYNALGQRSKLAHSDGTTTQTEYYLYDGAEVLQRRTNGTAASNADRVYFAQGERRKTGSTWSNQHYTRDHLGSIREVLASDGSLLARHDYTPYGARETRYEASGYAGTDFGFTGHFTLDSPVAGQQDLVLAHFRAYDPMIGRWLSQDPIREAGGVNLYGYVGGGVLMYTDPFGLCYVPLELLMPKEQREKWQEHWKKFGEKTVEELKNPLNWAFLGGLRPTPRIMPKACLPGVQQQPRIVPCPPTPSPPRSTPNFQPPTNPPQHPPAQIPQGWRIRPMPPTSQYPNGYWKLEKPMKDGSWQPIDPSTMKPGSRPETHVPLPPPQ